MTAQIINFAQVRNERRASAEIAKREMAADDRWNQAREELASRLGGSFGAEVVADVLTDAARAEKEVEQAGRYMPAYCDPENEKRGAKFEATRSLDIKEIAQRMRGDIKQAIKEGLIPQGVKTSVRIQRYSGGQSIDISVTALPEGFRLLSDKAASWRKQFPGQEHRMPMDWRDAQSEECRNLRGALDRIHAAYNRDNSDSMVDYFDVRYYGSVSIDWRINSGLEKAEVEASPGNIWADSCA